MAEVFATIAVSVREGWNSSESVTIEKMNTLLVLPPILSFKIIQ